MMPSRVWDIFCQVIDNFGDIGVCWRLSCALAQRGQGVRLWVDDDSALVWMAPQGCAGVQVLRWQAGRPLQTDLQTDSQASDVVIEAFGCEIDHAWVAMNSIAASADSMPTNSLKSLQNAQKPIWINLEYLSAESHSARNHGLRSPVLQGPAQGLHKWFFYPGFTPQTGGLIWPTDAALEIMPSPAKASSAPRISLFCYEPPALPMLLQQLANKSQRYEFIVTAGRAQQAVQQALAQLFADKNSAWPAENLTSLLSISYQPWMSQAQYDDLLQSCDMNFVRGEDSLVRALWAGRAFVWQLYPQQDGAHAAKLEAFLDWLQAPPDLRLFHRIWNGLQSGQLPPLNLPDWTACAQAARQRLAQQTDLVTQLLDFVEEKATSGV
jgi:uncharacterized repeat protein (TIGR03837 family)